MNIQCDTNKYVNCPRCLAYIYEKNLNRHMQSQKCQRGWQARNISTQQTEHQESKSICLPTTTYINSHGFVRQKPIEQPPSNNKSLLNQLLEDQKNIKKQNEMLNHELHCLEKMYMKLICAIENNSYKDNTATLNIVKRDQSTQTANTYHQIHFN